MKFKHKKSKVMLFNQILTHNCGFYTGFTSIIFGLSIFWDSIASSKDLRHSIIKCSRQGLKEASILHYIWYLCISSWRYKYSKCSLYMFLTRVKNPAYGVQLCPVHLKKSTQGINYVVTGSRKPHWPVFI